MKLVIIAVLLACGVARAQPVPMMPDDFAPGPVEDEPPAVDLVTFGVGDRIFEKYGHAALCLRYHDPNKLPVCFNYGVSEFDDPWFAWNFLRQKQEFWVEPESMGSLVGFYTFEDRDIWVQTLPLDGAAARQIEAKLWDDRDEAHRYYIYDHFFDNCTTRLRDMIDRATNGRLREGGDTTYPLTFRDIGERGLASASPLFSLTDFVAGRTLDRHPTRWEAMFHPDVLRQEVTVKLGVEPQLIYKRVGPEFPHAGGSGRWLTLLLAAVFALPLAIATRMKRFERTATAWAALYLTLWGIIVWGLVIISPIPMVRWNEAVLVMMPFDAVLPFLGVVKRKRYARWRVLGLLAVSLLCAIGILKQPLWVPILTAIVPNAIIAFL